MCFFQKSKITLHRITVCELVDNVISLITLMKIYIQKNIFLFFSAYILLFFFYPYFFHIKFPKSTIKYQKKCLFNFFTIPKPRYDNDFDMKVHYFSVNSWIQEDDSCSFIYINNLTNETLLRMYKVNRKIKLLKDNISTGLYNRQKIKDIFLTSIKYTKNGFVIIINSDIIVPQIWFNVTRKYVNKFGTLSIVYNSRKNIFCTNKKLFQKGFGAQQSKYLSKFKSYFQKSGVDLFLFHKNNTEINFNDNITLPDFFVIGICHWDTYLGGIFSDLKFSTTYNLHVPIFHLVHKLAWTKQSWHDIKNMILHSNLSYNEPKYKKADCILSPDLKKIFQRSTNKTYVL